ncbi:hypothetical protein EYF80_014569 [Liparis tanakae]|uniref:Uncharacterized protein n=1 Tax=Liparis tanakae TaxID=230148 RepID=A0A4Z2IAR4_9TELE|nr:hypothetical protein EYF80_014569 [Liparis tanakae]
MVWKQRCPSSLWQRVKTETDELSGSRGHLATSVLTDRSFTPLCLCPLTKRCPLKHWAVRTEGEAGCDANDRRVKPQLSLSHCAHAGGFSQAQRQCFVATMHMNSTLTASGI